MSVRPTYNVCGLAQKVHSRSSLLTNWRGTRASFESARSCACATTDFLRSRTPLNANTILASTKLHLLVMCMMLLRVIFGLLREKVLYSYVSIHHILTTFITTIQRDIQSSMYSSIYINGSAFRVRNLRTPMPHYVQ